MGVTLKVAYCKNYFEGEKKLSRLAYHTEDAAGFDLYANIPYTVKIPVGKRLLVCTGVKVEIPKGYVLHLYARSGLARDKGLTLLNGCGVIDADYRGEVQVLLVNLGNTSITIKRGDRIAQGVIEKYEHVTFMEVAETDLSETVRGTGGFGSTGVQ